MKKRKTILPIVLAVMWAVLLSACAGTERTSASDSAVTFIDDLGRSVTVENPQRVAALLGSFAQIWQLSGGQVIATADDAWEDLGLELPEGTVNLGSTTRLSMETLLASQPDFILATTNVRQNMEWRDTLESIGIPVAYFNVASFSDYLRMLGICTDITGRKDCYEAYGTEVQTRISAVLAASKLRPETEKAPTVLSLTASASFVKAKNSDGNVLGAMLKDLGCINVADSDTMLLEDLSIEQILISDPDYIFIVQRGDDEAGMRKYVSDYLTSHPAWSRLRAVRSGSVFFMEKELYALKPNNRWAEAYEKLEALLSHE